jgi:hypothetical protein
MDTFLGLIGMTLWIVSTIALAAAITYVVVKLTPGDKPPKEPEASSS